MVGHHNICLGKEAGMDLTTESYMLCMKFEGFKESRKQMTPEEYDKITSVIYGMVMTPEQKEVERSLTTVPMSCPVCHKSLWGHFEIEAR